MIRRWLALTYYLYALRLAALSHFYFNPLYFLHRLAYACGKFCDAGCKKSVWNRVYRLANLVLLWFNVMV